MGLDWIPLNKAKPGKEKEFEERFLILTGKKEIELSLIDKLTGRKEEKMKSLSEAFLADAILPYDTLNPPRVGYDDKANIWAKTKFEDRLDKSLTLAEFMKEMNGYYALDLLPRHDGFPPYISWQYEKHIFRAQFLINDCKDLLGADLLAEAYQSQLSKDTVNFGQRLMKLADNYAIENRLQHLKHQRELPDTEDDSPERKVHIIFSAAKWLLWWGERGHGYQAES